MDRVKLAYLQCTELQTQRNCSHLKASYFVQYKSRRNSEYTHHDGRIYFVRNAGHAGYALNLIVIRLDADYKIIWPTLQNKCSNVHPSQTAPSMLRVQM